jgi:MAE_28990/MAE_18760-like HEPN
MGIATPEHLETVITADLSWRKKELLQLRLRAISAPDWALPMYVRSGVTMLYAHWEGFVKATGEALVGYVRDQQLRLGELAPGYVAIALRKELAMVRESRSGATFPEIAVARAFAMGMGEEASLKPRGAIATGSNLSWRQFSMIAARLEMDIREFALLENFIDLKLVGVRNTIAHGDRTAPMDRPEFLLLHAKVLGLLDRVSHQALRVAESERFKIGGTGAQPGAQN